MFEGQVDPARQQHDFNPGIAPSGLFWTVPMPPESVTADLTKGAAMMRWANVRMPDQQDLMNALNSGPAFPSTVSFDVRWKGGMQKRKTVRNAQHKFALQIIETASTIEWQAERGDLRLTSDAGSAKTVYAFVGRERNGAFF